MIDLKILRHTPDLVREAIKNRGGRYSSDLEELIKIDKYYQRALKEAEHARTHRNEFAKKIGQLKKENPGEAEELLKETDGFKDSVSGKEDNVKTAKTKLDELLLGIANIPDASVPVGKSEKDNKFIREDLTNKKDFSFKPSDHHELGEKLGILDFKTASQLSGSRFVILKNAGARLERALINFMLDTHTREHGYSEIFTPFLVNSKTMTGTGQLPKFADDLYKITDENLYLIPTAEVTLTNMFGDTIFESEKLPMKFASYTACFRREAGSYGKDTKGLVRNHQFNKVELVWFAHPDNSMQILETLLKNAETILQKLKLPYRIIELCTADLGFSAAKTYDLEIWMPGENRYREISSCSNCTDFQARRIKTRFKDKNKPRYVHTLNGSGLAVGRTLAAVLENYQQSDGSVLVPQVLRKYFGEDKILPQ